MGKFDNIKISNFEELFSKTKTVAESLNKKSVQAFDMSRKRLDYLDAKAKISKLYEKFGRLQFSAFLEEDVDENELDMLTAQIIAYREKISSLKAQLDEACDNSDLKREAEDLKKEVIIASQEAKEVFMKQVENAKNAFSKNTQSSAKPYSDAFEATEVEAINADETE